MAPAFRLAGRAVRAEPLGVGLINRTFRVTVCAAGAGLRRYVLQAVNTSVFPEPRLLMDNLRRVTAHLGRAAAGPALRLVPAREGSPAWVDPQGRWWRAFEYVERAVTIQRIPSPVCARRAAAAFGRFVRDLDGLPGPPLHTVLPGFHHTPARLEALVETVRADPCGRVGAARPELERILRRSALAGVLEQALEAGAMTLRRSTTPVAAQG